MKATTLSRRRGRAWLSITTAFTLTLIACGGDERHLPSLPGGPAQGAGVRQVELQPGAPEPQILIPNPYGHNATAVAEGERLYNWYNCSGCHFAGGGGIGPPLMDDDWIYGSEPQNIYNTIMEGRPEGMPAYRGRISQEHAWQIVAYVQTLNPDWEPPAEDAERTGDSLEDRSDEGVGGSEADEGSSGEGSGGSS